MNIFLFYLWKEIKWWQFTASFDLIIIKGNNQEWEVTYP